jgi:hypothetical protein
VVRGGCASKEEGFPHFPHFAQLNVAAAWESVSLIQFNNFFQHQVSVCKREVRKGREGWG